MLAQLKSAALLGLSVHLVDIEVDAASGLPAWSIVGLPDAAVKESKERVHAAIKNAGYEFPPRRIVVNLAPAYLRKEGPSFDLAIAIAILTVTGQLRCDNLDAYLFLGELGLDGSLRPVKGILPISLEYNRSQYQMLVPAANQEESAVGGTTTYGFRQLRGGGAFFRASGAVWACAGEIARIFSIGCLRLAATTFCRLEDKLKPSGYWRLGLQAIIICSWSARPAQAKPCCRRPCRPFYRR